MDEQKNHRDRAQLPREESTSESVNARAAADLNNDAAERKRPISEKKLAANRANAQRSTGPKTTAGKANSSRNSYKHGLCAQHLFPPGSQGAPDQEAYEKLANCVRNHYRPDGAIEEVLVENVVAGMVRYARIIGHEQQALGEGVPFNNDSIAKILRYSTTTERQLMRSIRELERIQAAREDASGRSQGLNLVWRRITESCGRFRSELKGRCGSETLTQLTSDHCIVSRASLVRALGPGDAHKKEGRTNGRSNKSA